jgi:signal transduction histidine kinase
MGLTVVVAMFGAVGRFWENEVGQGGGLIAVGGVTVTAGAATALAYRRTSRPVSDLLDGAEHVAEGDYRIVLEPSGPRELRVLTETFNAMAGRLAAIEEQRRRFLADITHELRTPLAVLQSSIEAQLDGVHPRDDHHVGSLLEETQRLRHLVDDLHTLALTEAGRLVLEQEQVAPGVLVADVVERHTASARQRGVGLRPWIASEIPEIAMDPRRIRQVLDNLLTNAIRHTPPGREVRVELALTCEPGPGPGSGADAGADASPAVRFAVIDAGPGFPPDELGQVFERFTRAAGSRGSGLGLSIARDLVEAHGGTIAAANDPDTGGASVSFTLPT